ncbi:MAG: hypothetical protein ABJC04_10115 [Verrucomicrobiota bacterium]
MSEFFIPTSLQTWNKRITPILKKPFPPVDEPERKEMPHWDKISTWSLICEEILDTSPTPGLLRQYYDELLRRGFTDETIQEMRHFAWLTVGWLNYEKALWEWVILNESHIRRAVEWQEKDGLIDSDSARWMLKYVADKTSRA